jgi:hypothetical protein
MLGYGEVKCMPLLPASERILKNCFQRISFCCASETQCPKALQQFFQNSEINLWLCFARSQASLSLETIKVSEVDDKCATESAVYVKALLKLNT